MVWQPRLGNGTFTYKANTEAGTGLLNQALPRDPEDTLGVPADQRIGLHFQGLRDGDDGPVQVWSSGNGHYEVHVTEDGETSFLKDGDLHRHGGPAVITADGDEYWFNHGRHIPVVPDLPHDDASGVGTADETHRYVGTHHVHGDEVARTARKLRQDMKTLADVGYLPDGATVNVEGHGGRQKSVTVRIGGLPKGWASDGLDYTPEGQALRENLLRHIDKYNYWETGAHASETRYGFTSDVVLFEG
jgi:hypothetical protein